MQSIESPPLTPLSQDDVKNTPYLLVSGVGSPADVEETATAFMGIPPLEHLAFADHHVFTARDASSIRHAAQYGTRMILTTAKDAYKLATVANFPFHVLLMRPAFGTLALVRNAPDAPWHLEAGSFEIWWKDMAVKLGL